MVLLSTRDAGSLSRARASAGPARGRSPAALLALGIALWSATAFLPALGAGFLRSWDDGEYVLDNPLASSLAPANLVRMATTAHAANWHPLTWLSHAVDRALFGLDPRGHHATSLLLHAGNAALLFVALRALTGRTGASAAVALLFGVHPLRAESVVWISERKDLLCGLFFLGAVAAHGAYARRPGRARYLLVLALGAAALLSKPMAVTLPLVLLLLDVWPLRRLSRLPRGFPSISGLVSH
jgi:hypothetical protein